MKIPWLIILFAVFPAITFGNLSEKKTLQATYTTEKIVIDGNVNEAIWQTTGVAHNF